MNKTAKEMFEEYGYLFIIEDEENIIYVDEEDIKINFDKICKTFYKSTYHKYAKEICMEELQAINKQIEELGWNKC